MLAFDAVRKLMGKGHGEVIPLRAFVAQLLPLDIPDDEAVLNNWKPYPLQIFGLSSRCIKPGVRKALEELLVDQMSLQAFRHDE